MTEVVEKVEKPAKKAVKLYEITFHSGDNDDNSDVVIGWNAKLNQFKRNVKTTIDENFLGVLKDAVIHTTVKGEDGKVTNVSIPRFSYTVNPL
jgi:hypothetical protein